MQSKEKQLEEIIRAEDWLMECLKAVRDLELPDVYIAAGAIRNTVWNVLHDFPGDANQKDIDVVYFDPNDSVEREEELEKTLKQKISQQEWEVKNQAHTHKLKCTNSRKPASSSTDSIAYWPEIPTCIGARLEINDSITITAPYGLEDLFNLIVTPIPEPKQNIELYKMRYHKKQWQKTWPKLKIQKP